MITDRCAQPCRAPYGISSWHCLPLSFVNIIQLDDLISMDLAALLIEPCFSSLVPSALYSAETCDSDHGLLVFEFSDFCFRQ